MVFGKRKKKELPAEAPIEDITLIKEELEKPSEVEMVEEDDKEIAKLQKRIKDLEKKEATAEVPEEVPEIEPPAESEKLPELTEEQATKILIAHDEAIKRILYHLRI